ncbi:16S rRNA (cytidine(1402)-2'-O)-methyltransferase [Candidatus Solincola sp.]|jgi:16S rRNA (cytidine1402-2'-O)-methyltransferase|nr:16S rRNA (cytidine(1402)-2'-O)-methyltransferase [Actinomycetota bacterium]MDI7251020.1 16S rRNA (cytidine(1402)-2'-O)-methyltransferase [Actinomycetota bacterium]
MAEGGRGRLYLVGTPIGNLEDITLRALRVLREADLIAAEDTRRARKLLSRYDIHTPLTSYHGHNEREKAEAVAREVEAGKKVALVSDAGMPGVADPGFRAVEECVRRGLEVEVVPGPSSLTAALALSGLPLARFRYEGFLPPARTRRRSRLMSLLGEGEAVVLYEAPHRILDTMSDIAELAPERQVVLARELTKLHEEVLRGTADELLEALRERRPRGEFVLVLAPGKEGEAPPLAQLADEVSALVLSGEPTREAVRAVAQRHGVSQRDVYRAWLERREGRWRTD